MKISQSYLTVNYGLRPSKQVERRIFIDSFILLTEAGFIIRDYQYIGMGSVHFIDFALFHKYFGIDKMLSIEADPSIKDRVKFNLPYREIIDIKVGEPIGNYLTEFNKGKKYFVWLDYDNVLYKDMLEDIALSLKNLTPGSLLIITVDTESPLKISTDDNSIESLQRIKDYFLHNAKNYISPSIRLENFCYENLPRINIEILKNVITSNMNYEEEVFFLLYSFLYADGHRMLTIGGMKATSKQVRKLKKSRLLQQEYIRTQFNIKPFNIHVPCITKKEQLYLDSYMPCEEGWCPEDFEMKSSDINAYKKIYRFYPSYAELLF